MLPPNSRWFKQKETRNELGPKVFPYISHQWTITQGAIAISNGVAMILSPNARCRGTTWSHQRSGARPLIYLGVAKKQNTLW